MLTLDKSKIVELYNADLLYDIHTIQEKIKLFEVKYHLSFELFENKIKTEQEDFAKWDDYME